MLNLNPFLLLIVIPFSFQDKNCLIKWKACENTNYQYETEEEGSIENCIKYFANNDQKCKECKNGFSRTSDYQSCISFPYCDILETGNVKCKKCRKYFHLNSEGQCIPTFCKNYINEGKENEYCSECLEGYYLNEQKECIKIPFENCLLYIEATEKCTTCLGYISPNEDGNCHQVFIEGCKSYTSGKCTMCSEDFYTLKEDGTCEFNGCENGEKIIEYCPICKIGYEIDPSDGICVGYNGSKDIPSSSSSPSSSFSSSSFSSSSSYSENNRIELFLFFFVLVMLI